MAVAVCGNLSAAIRRSFIAAVFRDAIVFADKECGFHF
jgi:hypothetical protein